MTLLLTILFVSALLVLVAGGLLASDPCLNPPACSAGTAKRGAGRPEAPRTFPGPSAITSRSAPGKLRTIEDRELSEDARWWRDWWVDATEILKAEG